MYVCALMAQIEACIFDLDGVIVETSEMHFQSWKRLADQLNIPFTQDDNEKMKGISRMDSLDVILAIGEVEKSLEERQALAYQKNEWYKEYLDKLTPENILPGVLTFIKELKRSDIKIALGSASKNARQVLNKTEISNLFGAVVDGNDVSKSKPDPEVFIKAAGLLTAKPANTVVFEDSFKGLEAANSGGFFAVGIGHQDILYNADKVISTFEGFTFSQLQEFYDAYINA